MSAQTWRPDPATLTDDEIVAVCRRTMLRYRPLGRDVAARITAARLRRLYARRAVQS